MLQLLLAPAAAAGLVLALGPVAVPLLRRLKFGQRVRDNGPRAHAVKQGTPTMGGILFILAFTVVSVAFTLGGPERYAPGGDSLVRLGLVLLGALGYGLLGFVDDFRKVVLKRPLGLRAREKLLGQFIVAALVGGVALGRLGLSTVLHIPFGLGRVDAGFLYLPFLFLVMLGTSNAVNLTDGLDGLAAGTSVIVFGTYTLIAYAADAVELAIFSAAVAGACAGFLRFNYHPARVFMGDTGSLALGGGLGVLAVLTKTELVLLLVGGLFAVETISVVIQVLFFQTTGRRIFRMSPLHHHFELVGWSELQVVHRFWVAAAFMAGLGLISMMMGGV
ncbi:MAG: phospho-N-acetylmuramoyl-pentapeptide-transferase [Bacillota bacterium]